MPFLIVGLIGLLIAGAIGAWVAIQKGRDPIEGGVLGFFLGPVGWILEGLLPVGGLTEVAGPPGVTPRVAVPSTPPAARAVKRCPDCAEDVSADARLCRWCRHEFAVPVATPVPSPGPGSVPTATDAAAQSEPPLDWPAGQWRGRPGWSPAGRFRIDAVASRALIPVSFAWLLKTGATLRLAPKGDGTWMERETGTAALVTPEEDGVAWAVSDTSPGVIVLASASGRPLAILTLIA